MSSKAHISVCVCTYQRPRYLEILLQSLSRQKTLDEFSYSVVVIDNDSSGSARDTVERFAEKAAFQVTYDCEPAKSISLARNRAVYRSGVDCHIAFIDDDEFAPENWLYSLYSTMKAHGADGVLGPVFSYFDGAPPKWIKSSRVLDRETFNTGTPLFNPRYTRTGNVLFAANLFETPAPFDPAYGETGGEDSNLFKQLIRQGRKFIWCNEAPVYEHVPPDRWKRSYHLKRALLRGSVYGLREGFTSPRLLKSLSAFMVYTALLPFFLFAGQGCFMRYFVKNCDHLGFLLSFCGIRLVTEKI